MKNIPILAAILILAGSGYWVHAQKIEKENLEQPSAQQAECPLDPTPGAPRVPCQLA